LQTINTKKRVIIKNIVYVKMTTKIILVVLALISFLFLVGQKVHSNKASLWDNLPRDIQLKIQSRNINQSQFDKLPENIRYNIYRIALQQLSRDLGYITGYIDVPELYEQQLSQTPEYVNSRSQLMEDVSIAGQANRREAHRRYRQGLFEPIPFNWLANWDETVDDYDPYYGDRPRPYVI